MLSIESRFTEGDCTSPRANSWSEPSVMDTYMPGAGGSPDMWTSEQVNDLLTSLDSNSHHHDNNSNNNSNNSGPHSPLDSNYTYASADPTAAPHVVLSPSWTLPRRAGGAEQNPLASLQQYQANNPLPDVAGLNMLSSPGLSDSMHSPMLAPTDMAGMLLSQSPPIYSHQPFASASSQSQSMPFSAPANSFEFDHHLDFYPQQQQQQQQQPNVLLQPDASGQQRQSSWPLSPPPLSTPSPVPQFSRAGTQPPEGLSVETSQTFGRRRSISMSGMELQAAAAAAASSVAATHVASSGPVRPRPSRNRSASNLSHHRPTAHNQRPPTGPDSLYTVPRSPSAKERRAVASKRRATLQSVIADAKLPSAPPSSAPAPPPMPRVQQQPHDQLFAQTLQPAARIPSMSSTTSSSATSATGSSSVTLEQALDALAQAQGYIEESIGPSGDGDFGYITPAHVHLLKDLRARLKARS